jgi:prepilin-type N-terminal cleavage/methylation domain-containing protein
MENHIAIEEKKQDKGFTLVELLIVIVILGILATVTVFAVQGITTRGKETACRADHKTLLTAIEANMADRGVFPTSLAELATNGLLADDGISTNFTYVPLPAGGPFTSYTLTATALQDCDGVAF